MSLRRREIPFMNFSHFSFASESIVIEVVLAPSRDFERYLKTQVEPGNQRNQLETMKILTLWAGEFESSQRCGRIGEIMLVTRLPLLFLTNSSLHHHRRLVVDWQNQLKWQTFNFKIFSSFTSLVVCFAEEQWTWNSNYFRRRQTRNDLEKLFFPIRYIAEHELPPLDNPIGWWINGV